MTGGSKNNSLFFIIIIFFVTKQLIIYPTLSWNGFFLENQKEFEGYFLTWVNDMSGFVRALFIKCASAEFTTASA